MTIATTTLDAVDEFLIDRFTKLFAEGDGSKGWDLLNIGIFADHFQNKRVIDEMVARGVLFRCEFCSNMNHVPLKCDRHEYDFSNDEEDEWPDDEELCACGEPVGLLCVCAELESYRAHQADPGTRGSWWTP